MARKQEVGVVIRAIDKATRNLATLRGAFGAFGAFVAAVGVAKLGGLFVRGARAAISAAADFEQEMSRVAAVAGATGAQLDTLSKQAKDLDFLLALGELFTMVAYGQLIIEYRNLHPDEMSDDLLDLIFDLMVRDFSSYALQIYSKASSSAPQMEAALKMIKKPARDDAQYERVWSGEVLALKDQYVMNE